MYARQIRLTIEQMRAIGAELNLLKNQCVAEGKAWLPELDTTDIPRSTAHRLMRVDDNWEILRVHLSSVENMGVVEALNWASETYCRSCRLNGPKKSCKDCAAMRQSEPREDAGLDQPEPYEKRIAATEKAYRKDLEMLAKTKAAKPGVVDAAYRGLEMLAVNYKLLHAAPTKPAPSASKGKCKFCKAEILWVTTQKGKRMPLNAEPGGGQFRIGKDNRAEHVKYDPEADTSELYRNHHLCCPARKKT